MATKSCQSCGKTMYRVYPTRRFCSSCQHERNIECYRRQRDLMKAQRVLHDTYHESQHNGSYFVTTCPSCKRTVRYPEMLVALIGIPCDQITCNKCRGRQ